MRGRHGIASQGICVPPCVGMRRPSIRKKVAAEIAVDASMLTALRRPRMTLSAVNEPERTGDSKTSLSEGQPEKSSRKTVPGLDVAPATSSITGHSTPWSRLRTLAFPCHGPAATSRTASSGRGRSCGSSQVPGVTTARSSGCSRSAPASSASRSTPSSIETAESLSPRRRSFHPRAAAAMRMAPSACPTSCWQYRNARSPYFQASRQSTDVRPTRKELSGNARVSPVQTRGSTSARRSSPCSLGA